MRRTSVSLPTKHLARDPHEKPGRYKVDQQGQPGFLARMHSAWMSQTQRARWIKTGAIVFAVFFLFYYLSPTGVDLYSEGAKHL